MKKKNDNNVKSMVLAIVAVVFIAGIAAGGTYAYWTWQSADANKTNVSFTIQKPGFTIVGDNVTSTNLMPTAKCYNTPASNHVQHTMAGKATVTATNNTTTAMRATITLKGTLSKSLDATAVKSHIHWAIKKVSAANTAFSNANCSGTAGAEYDTGTFESVGTTATDIATTITFDVAAGGNTTNYYQVYVWVDSSYTAKNTGSTVSDPLQGTTVTLTFSDSSEFTQIQS